MANTTIYDVAGAAKVSLATVSRVMNNPEKVNPETRDRVLKVIKELGYRPNAIARGLASRKTTTIGIIMADISRASNAQLLSGVMDIAKKYDYSIKIFSISPDDDITDAMRIVIAEQVDGILFLNDELDKDQMKMAIDYIKDAMVPVVLSNVFYEDEDIPLVAIDYETAVYDITRQMIAYGRKDIYLFTTARTYTINTKKEAGYLEAMKEAGLEPKIFRTSGDVAINTLHFTEFFNNNDNKVDAVLAVRDSIAVSFMNVAANCNIRIPEDISVVGLQNTKYASLSRPTLTCVDTPVYDIGAVSMRLLTKYMKQETVEMNKVLLPYRFIRRNSTNS
ncbi:MAG: LacI family DNA-binding transcriptional regulator [Anaeroplasmataceae bacterium]|nr:LacI family DNA-binding transcriptional regulator [Anaeroplasmataceae bacterium]MDE5867439.1 LacI family DNA-binding transcriptional regulator [Anaeroplasmataceae bacterium]